MPTRAARACPGCSKPTTDRRCPRCAPRAAAREQARLAAVDARRPSPAARGYDGKWKALRVEILTRDPVCVLCRKRDSKHVDHITPKRAGGSDHPSNLQGTCWPCHSRKTAAEDGGFGNPVRGVAPGAAAVRAAQLRAAAARS
jgi:5-methylcytosine-specific restriction protein A